MKYYSLIVCCILLNVALAQKSLTIKDAATKQGLPYATAECFKKQWGNYADSAGNVSLIKLNDEDSVFISFVGYESKTVLYKELKDEVFLDLKQKEDVIVVSCNEKEELTIGYKNKGKNPYISFGGNDVSGETWAAYIPNENSKKFGYIVNLEYNATSFYKKSILCPTRIRIYEYDTITRLPGKEITDESIIFTPKKFGKNVIDISEYKLKMPPNGVVVGLEFFDDSERYYYNVEIKFPDGKKTIKTYGYSIEGIRNDLAKCFCYVNGKGWVHTPTRLTAPYFRLKVKYCK